MQYKFLRNSGIKSVLPKSPSLGVLVMSNLQMCAQFPHSFDAARFEHLVKAAYPEAIKSAERVCRHIVNGNSHLFTSMKRQVT